ncbi:hypothetical protein BH11PSE14_BH11PSE14_08180 [soil metagenome]
MKKSLLAFALAAVLPLSANAADKLSYTYVEGNYQKADHGVDGWGLRGSFDFGTSGLYGLGSYSWLNADGVSGNIKANELGLGYHHGLSDKTDLIGEVAYRNAKSSNLNIDGARASVGVRSAMTDRVEGFVKANYYDLSDYSGDFSATVGGQYKFNDQWGATAEAEFGSGDKAMLVGLRASF